MCCLAAGPARLDDDDAVDPLADKRHKVICYIILE